MPLLILLFFIAVPIVEIALFIQVGGWLGLWPTLGLVVLTAVIGVSLLRAQGLATMMRAQASLDQGQMPLREVFDGACLLIAGAMLLTPGFFTDGLGFALLIPTFRDILVAVFGKLIAKGTIRTSFHGSMGGGMGPGMGPGMDGHHRYDHGQRHKTRSETDTVIDGEYEDVTDSDDHDEDKDKDPPRKLH